MFALHIMPLIVAAFFDVEPKGVYQVSKNSKYKTK